MAQEPQEPRRPPGPLDSLFQAPLIVQLIAVVIFGVLVIGAGYAGLIYVGCAINSGNCP
jgi:hypothetical protein